jgi:hypothetical protein
MGMFVRALAYMMSHGADGLRQVAEDACSTPITCAPSRSELSLRSGLIKSVFELLFSRTPGHPPLRQLIDEDITR